MNELLLKIQDACLQMDGLSLGVPAGIAIIMGLVLWLGGNRYSGFVIGVLGAGVGAVIGLLLSNEMGWPVAGGVSISAAVFCLAAVLLRRVVILMLASLIFAAVLGGGYFSYRINTESWNDKLEEIKKQAMMHSLESAGSEESPERDYLRILANRYRSENSASKTEDPASRAAGAFEEIWAEIRYAASENKGMLILWGIAGAAAGLAIAWLLKALITALCCSIVGSAAVIGGMIAMLLAKGTPVITSLMNQPRVIFILFIAMILFGMFTQLIIGAKKKKATPDKEEK